MSGRRVLVTGAAGFLGSHVAEGLLAVGNEVVLLDALVGNYDAAIKRGNLAELPAVAGPLVEVDLCDANAVTDAVARARPDVVVHCAALAGVRPSVERPAAYAEHNVVGTINLLEAMHAAGCTKLVFASSSSVYGADAAVPFVETDTAVRPVSPYAATKRACELYLHTYQGLNGLDYMALRLFTVYGPRQRPDLAIHRFTRAILSGEPVTLHGDGTSSRDYTHVDDITAGLIAAVDHVTGRDGVGEIVNLGSSSPVLLRELLEIIEKACGRQAVVQRVGDQPGDVPRTFADVSKARRLLGYDPTRDLVEGVEDFVTWWRIRFLS